MRRRRKTNKTRTCLFISWSKRTLKGAQWVERGKVEGDGHGGRGWGEEDCLVVWDWVVPMR